MPVEGQAHAGNDTFGANRQSPDEPLATAVIC
jgi:hypothetical protein